MDGRERAPEVTAQSDWAADRGSLPRWSRLLREAREAIRLSRREVSERTGISVNSLYSFEAGRRQPSRRAVLTLSVTLVLSGPTMNEILTCLDLPIEPSPHARWFCGLPTPAEHLGPRRRRQAKSLPPQDLLDQIRSFPWPCLVFDESCLLVGANDMARRTFASVFRALDRSRVHLLELVAAEPFRRRTVNWIEVVRTLVPSEAKPFLSPASAWPADPASLQMAIGRIRRLNPDALRELALIWEGHQESEVPERVVFELRWVADGGALLRFHGIASAWSAADRYWAVDFHPANSTTFEAMDASTDA